MIQRALATLLCLMGAAAIASGIASATAWRADDVLVASAAAAPGTTMIVTDPGVLDLAADSVTVTASGDPEVVIALGRAEDVEAWVGGDAHTRVTGLAKWHVLATRAVEAEPEPEPTEEATADPTATPAATATPAETPAATPAATETPAATDAEGAADADADANAEPAVLAPDPSGSDLWLSEVSGSRPVEFDWTAREGRWSVLVAAVGEGAEAPTVSLAWPQVVTTPWLWPGVIGGSLLLLAGIAWWVFIVVARRRAALAKLRPILEPEPEPEPVTGPSPALTPGVPAAPLTRRQIRELEEQQRARGGRGARTGRTGQFPVVAARAQRATDEVERPTSVSATPPEQATSAPGRWGRFSALSRRESAAPTAPTASTASARPPAVPTVPMVPEPTVGRPVPPVAAGPTPAASADAWRRAWGLPAASSGQPAPGQPGQPGQPVPGGWPGVVPPTAQPTSPPTTPPDRSAEPPVRRRRDNR